MTYRYQIYYAPRFNGCLINRFKLILMSKTIDFKKSIQGLSAEDLTARITEDELRLKKLEFGHAISPLENPMSIRVLRRELARLKTELKKKQLGV